MSSEWRTQGRGNDGKGPSITFGSTSKSNAKKLSSGIRDRGGNAEVTKWSSGPRRRSRSSRKSSGMGAAFWIFMIIIVIIFMAMIGSVQNI